MYKGQDEEIEEEIDFVSIPMSKPWTPKLKKLRWTPKVQKSMSRYILSDVNDSNTL